MKALFTCLLLIAANSSPAAELIFSGYLRGGDSTQVVLTDATSGKSSGWLVIGGSFVGATVVSFDATNEVLRITRDNRTEDLPLKRDAVRDSRAPSAARRAFVEKLAIASASPNSDKLAVGLLYVHAGDHLRAYAVGHTMDESLGLKVHAVTAEPDGVLVVFTEPSGALLTRHLPVMKKPRNTPEPKR